MTPRAPAVPAPLDIAKLVRRVGFWAGPALAVVLYFALPSSEPGVPASLSPAGRTTLAMLAWMATWWMTEAVPIEATALLPIVAFPLAGVMPLGDTTAAYGSDVVFLFLGGFVLAAAIQKHGLDRRIAFATLRVVGAKPGAIVAGVMGATAFLSMWVSNTATAAMMVPIALSVINVSLERRTGRTLAQHGGIPADDLDNRNFALATLLGVAYAASIGGLGTIVGSPPNGILVRYLGDEGRRRRLPRLDDDRRPGDARVPAARVVHQREAPVPHADGRDRGRARVRGVGVVEAGAARSRRADHACGVRVHGRAVGLSAADRRPRAGQREAVRAPLRCRHRDGRGARAVHDPGEPRAQRDGDGLGDRRAAAVGRADPVRRRACAGGRGRDERRRGVHRGAVAGAGELAVVARASVAHRHHGVHVGGDVEHRAGRDDDPDPRRARPGARPARRGCCWCRPRSARAARS